MSEKKYVVIPFENAEDATAFMTDDRIFSGANLLDSDEYPTKRYNGWRNYETWAVKLWMDNESGSFYYWKEASHAAWNEAKADDILTREQRARYNLADRLKDEHEAKMILVLEVAGEEATVWGDLLSAALSEVNWSEIAESLLEDVDKTAAEEPEDESEAENV